MIVDGRAFLGAVAHFQGDRFGSTGNGGGGRGVDLWLSQVFAEHFGLRFNVLLGRNSRPEGLFHRTNAAGKSVLRVQLNAQTFLNLTRRTLFPAALVRWKSPSGRELRSAVR